MIRRITEPNIEKEIFSEIGKLLQSQKVGREPLAEPPPVSFDVRFDSRLGADSPKNIETREPLSQPLTIKKEHPFEGIQKPERSPVTVSLDTNKPFQVGNESITLEALLSIESGITELGLPRLVKGILKAKGFSLSGEQRNSERSLSLLAYKGEFGLGDTRILVQVVNQQKELGLDELEVSKRLAQVVQADRKVLAIWQDELPPDEVKELVAQGWVVWNRVKILSHILECHGALDEEIRLGLRIKTIWVQV